MPSHCCAYGWVCRFDCIFISKWWCCEEQAFGEVNSRVVGRPALHPHCGPCTHFEIGDIWHSNSFDFRSCFLLLSYIRLRLALLLHIVHRRLCHYGLPQIGSGIDGERPSIWILLWRPSRYRSIHLDSAQRHKARTKSTSIRLSCTDLL